MSRNRWHDVRSCGLLLSEARARPLRRAFQPVAFLRFDARQEQCGFALP